MMSHLLIENAIFLIAIRLSSCFVRKRKSFMPRARFKDHPLPASFDRVEVLRVCTWRVWPRFSPSLRAGIRRHCRRNKRSSSSLARHITVPLSPRKSGGGRVGEYFREAERERAETDLRFSRATPVHLASRVSNYVDI
ncbi:hypothetical protein PUN28_014346 [Cardiocondyla obscurior]|uniref:Secreted protein n=1 Tax=Cardiocondyla obscurior TaxID=286306 RepID=A0AAW2EZQ4_9HYME